MIGVPHSPGFSVSEPSASASAESWLSDVGLTGNVTTSGPPPIRCSSVEVVGAEPDHRLTLFLRWLHFIDDLAQRGIAQADAAHRVAMQAFRLAGALPSAAPTDDRNVLLVWRRHGLYVDIEILPDERVHWYAAVGETQDGSEEPVVFASAASLHEFLSRVHSAS
ncbi:MAG: hypothetical protein H6704_30965 [Myxococcales bacterium]|nr:hypothetical protein [Myxococcales bacterium]